MRKKSLVELLKTHIDTKAITWIEGSQVDIDSFKGSQAKKSGNSTSNSHIYEQNALTLIESTLKKISF